MHGLSPVRLSQVKSSRVEPTWIRSVQFLGPRIELSTRFYEMASLAMIGNLINDVLSFVIFSILDVLDLVLCYVYKIVDFIVESEWKPCYCSSSKEAITGTGKILVSEKGESNKIVCLTSTKLQLEEISDTLYTRPSLLSEVSKTTVKELKRRKIDNTSAVVTAINKSIVRSTFTVNNTIVEMLEEKIGRRESHPVPRWSDCDCDTCNSWSNACQDTLFVHTDGPKGMFVEPESG